MLRYSILSAFLGEIDAARFAGMMAAKKEQIASAPAATVSASGSQEETPYSWAEIKRPAPIARGKPTRSPTKTRLNAPPSTSRITFGRSAPSAMRMPISLVRCGTAVQSNSREHQSYHPEQAGEAGYRALLIERKFDLLLQGPDAVDRQVGIQLRQHPPEQSLERAWGHTGYQHHSADEVGAQLNFLHQFVRVRDILGQGHVEHRTRGPAQAPPRELGIAHDADDTEGSGILGHVEAKVLIQGIFVALQKTLHESLVDNGHGRGGFIVRCGKRAPTQNRHAKILKIVGAHAIPGSACFLVEFGGRMAGDHDQLAPVVGKRVIEG